MGRAEPVPEAERPVERRRTFAEDIGEAVGGAADRVVHANLLTRLLIEHLGIVVQTPEGALLGKGHYAVFYCPAQDWSKASPNQTVGDWIYGEWSGERTVEMPLETGALVSGSRVALAIGKAKKAGNGTEVVIDKLAVGLIESVGTVDRVIRFVGAVNMSGLHQATSTCREADFFSAVTSFIHSRGNRVVPAFYPLKPMRRGARP